MYYVYALAHPVTGRVRYVGYAKDVNARFKQHLKLSRLKGCTHRENWLKHLLSQGLQPVVHALGYFDTKEDALAAEIRWIAWYRSIGAELVNTTAGGEGGATRAGKKQSAEEKAKRGRTRRSIYKDTLDEKECRGCRRLKPRDQFWKTPQSFDGLRARCVACTSAYAKSLHRRWRSRAR